MRPWSDFGSVRVIIYGSEGSSQVLKTATRGLETLETKAAEGYLSCRRDARLLQQRVERQLEMEGGLKNMPLTLDRSFLFTTVLFLYLVLTW